MLTTEVPYAAQRTTAHDYKKDKATKKDKDRFFDPCRTMITQEGKRLIIRLADMISDYEMDTCLRERRRRIGPHQQFLCIVDAVICNLLLARLLDDPRPIAVSRSKEKLSQSTRYQPDAFGKQLPDVLDVMNEMGWLHQRIGPRHSKSVRQTTIIIGEELADLCSGITLSDIGQRSGSETIILTERDEENRRHLVDYMDTDQTDDWRRRLAIINSSIARADVQFDTSVRTKRPVDINAITLRRQFINGRFDHHGRMYGSFWINMKKAERRAGLTINGESVIGLDYGQTFLRLAYGMAGQPLPDLDDLYLIPGLEDHRKGVKRLVSAMFNVDCLFSRAPKDTRKHLPKGMNIETIQQMIMEYHHLVAHLLCSGVGQKLTITESEVMTEVLLRLIAKGLVALPVHDCIIIARSHEQVAREIMLDTFKEMVGVEASVSVQ